MNIQVALNHITTYNYDRCAKLNPQIIRLKPAPHAKTKLNAYTLQIHPKNHFVNWQQDPFGNYLARVIVPEKTKSFKVEVSLIAQMNVFNPFDFFLDEEAKKAPFDYQPETLEELAPYLAIKEEGPLLQNFISKLKQSEKLNTLDYLININQKLNKLINYTIRHEPGVQTCEYTLQNKSGSCRDMAWLLCQVLRHLGLASRFSSGYLIQLVPDVKAAKGPSGPTEDFTDLHAWCEVYLPGAGWVGLDPTSGLLAGEGHIPVCCTPNPSSAAPITGSLEPCEVEFKHEMTLKRIVHENPTVKPYTSQTWDAINHVGLALDKDIKKLDMRLTMGGEPTFVSLTHQDDNAWQLGALSEHKKIKGKELLAALGDTFADKPLMHLGQGKWYPGEILPRWCYTCFWRLDNQPIWTNSELNNLDESPQPISRQEARDLLVSICSGLGLNPDTVMPAYEDKPYHLWQNQKLSLDNDLINKSTFDELEVSKLKDIFNDKIDQPVGYVLPLNYSTLRDGWFSNHWAFKQEKLILQIGNSSIGYRLPLNRLSDPKPAHDLFDEENTLEDMTMKLPTQAQLLSRVLARAKNTNKSPCLESDPVGMLHTALCVEIRDDCLYVFLPPLSKIETMLDLITTIEWAAEKHKIKVILEGYSPASDSRVCHFKVTPDPGVVEVNTFPVGDWGQLSNQITTIYQTAHKHELSAEKFQLDGRKVSSGGGNHIILGGPTRDDSPFLRRPDMLQSFISFWQNHPSLSYLFSGLFIGPTSQSPRVDEARHESLYELEIAFKQLKNKEPVPLWLVDRLFRNILIDVTGNTHRTEICIDKLYSPDSNAGRLGLLELRCFEMPPHPQLSLVQYLLVKGLACCFWETPYEGKLKRWGTRLHDEYMLPHFVWQNFKQVLQFLNHNDKSFNLKWFEPFMSFRFPIYGKTTVGPFEIELRAALEPWPVMGEESTQSGTSRSVDSSCERLQVKVTGPLSKEYAITCNGYVLPLKQIDHLDEYICGVRYKAWPLHASLHPTIKPHTPLVFDVIDLEQKISLGGCTYHTSNPGGRSHDTYPVNDNEADGRRLIRFDNLAGSAQSTLSILQPSLSDEFRYTLDLRLQ